MTTAWLLLHNTGIGFNRFALIPYIILPPTESGNLTFQDITVKSFEAIILAEVSDIIKNGIDKEKMEDVFLAITDWEESVLGYAQYLLNRITTEISMSSEHVGE